MHLLTNTAAFVFALGVIIFVHEGGHYLVAKAFGVRVLAFSLGFGKKIWGFARDETEYKVCWIPLGGYVRLGGESPEEATGDPRDFLSRPRWQRVLVYLAGPAMNVVLAILLIAAVFMIGLEVPYLQDIPAVVGTVEAESPAAAAGIESGDRVVAVQGQPVERWQDVAMAVMQSPDKPLALTLERGNRRQAVQLTPRRDPKYEFGDAGFFPRVLPRISLVTGDSPAQRAGFAVGDQIREVDGRPLASPAEFVRYIEAHPGQQVVVQVERQEQLVEVPVVPEDQGGKGRIGVGLTIAQRFGPIRAFQESLAYNWEVTRQTVVLVGKLLNRQVKPQSALSGPIEIAALSGEAARQGLPSLLHLMGLVSISIAILNLLPIPVLDGGQIAILLVESLMRRDLSLRLKEAINLVGLAIIVLLMTAVIIFDLGRNLPSGWSPGSDATSSEAPAP